MHTDNVHTTPDDYTFEDIASGFTSGMFDHMRLILTKNNDQTLGQKYLYLSRNTFGLVRLHDVDFFDNKIRMDIEVISTGLRKKVHLDINDSAFKFLLISWHDIKHILNSNIIHKTDSAGLLEFEF